MSGRENRRYLPGVPFPARLNAGADLVEALAGVELALVAVPSHAYGRPWPGCGHCCR